MKKLEDNLKDYKKNNKNVDVSIIIVNYKSWLHLENCLTSLISKYNKKFIIEIIVVDNCSNDGKLENFSEKFPSIIFIKNTGNNGFANACNFGATYSLGNFLFFLNPDTIADRESIYKIYKTYIENKEIGILSCSQINNKGKIEKMIRLFPDTFTLFGFTRFFYRKFNKDYHKKLNSKNNIIFSDWVSGSSVFISKNWFHKINGWNEDFWMYYEDIDICKKVKDLNGSVALLKDVTIIHNHGGSSRINIKTATLTKMEVLISKHVYINTHFKGVKRFFLQLLTVLNNLFSKMIFAILGLFFFFIPKLKLELILWINLINYYFNSIKNKTWLSLKSMNYPNK